MTEQETFKFDGWAIFEAMGHIKRVGKVRTSELGGNAVFVVETADPEGQPITEIFAASALFRLTPVTQAVAEQTAKSVNPSPITAYDLPTRVQRALRAIQEEDREKSAALPSGDTNDDYYDDVPL